MDKTLRGNRGVRLDNRKFFFVGPKLNILSVIFVVQ